MLMKDSRVVIPNMGTAIDMENGQVLTKPQNQLNTKENIDDGKAV